MANSISFSSKIQKYDPTDIPARWLNCPRKSTIIAEKFLAFKTPLDDRYDAKVNSAYRWTCHMLIDSITRDQKNLGLVIDLTNTDRYYSSDIQFGKKKISYEKIYCSGHDETPDDEQIDRFIKICNEFISSNPNDIIGVHCTHGFNRTGFLICAYLYQERHINIDIAIDLFAKARSPGIYKQDYLNKLVQRYSNGSINSILAPSRPDWCLTNSDTTNKTVRLDAPKRTWSNNNTDEKFNKRIRENSNPQFAVDLPNVTPVSCQSTLNNIRLKCQQMCQWDRQSFPGSQPISMDYTNYQMILLCSYMVSWKADGTRYMMLIDGENEIYMLDRNNNVFKINHLRFPKKDTNFTQHLTNTLVDGEFVVDNDNGIQRYRYLIYDIIIYENENVGIKPFSKRLGIIYDSIVQVRNKAIEKGSINKNLEPFSIKNKDFWGLSTVSKLLSPEFQSQITHGMDGLVFQPELDPYQPGRSPRVLKWKDDNTIDFRLKIIKLRNSEEKKALLYVTRMSEAYDSMRYSLELDKYDNQIIECSYRNGEWHFYRHRVDKSYPNAKETADGVSTALKHPITAKTLWSLIEEHIAFNNY